MKKGRLLNTFDIFSLGLGGAIGSGIFVMMGMGIDFTGHSIVLALLISAVLMMLAYMYNIIMASMFNLKGGNYSQLKLLFGPFLIGINGIFTLISGCSFTVYAVGLVKYMESIFPEIAAYEKLLSILVMSLFFLVTIRGSKFIALLQNAMVMILGVSIATFVCVGLPQVQDGFFNSTDFFAHGGNGFLQAISIMGFACMGTTMAPVAMSSVTKNATRTVPKAILLITVAIGLIYSLMAVVASGVLPLTEVAGKDLSVVARTIFPHWAYIVFILGGGGFALATSLMSAIAMLRFPVEQVAEDGWLPKVFTRKTKAGYPWVIQLTFYFISTVPILFGFSFHALVSFVMIPLMLICALSNYQTMKMPKRYPENWQRSMFSRYPIAFTQTLLLLGVGADLIVAYNLFNMLNKQSMIGIGILLVVCVVLALFRLFTRAVDVQKIRRDSENERLSAVVSSAV